LEGSSVNLCASVAIEKLLTRSAFHNSIWILHVLQTTIQVSFQQCQERWSTAMKNGRAMISSVCFFLQKVELKVFPLYYRSNEYNMGEKNCK
jgi:hypothetical protein